MQIITIVTVDGQSVLNIFKSILSLYLVIHNHLYLPLSSFQWMILSLTISVSWYHGSRDTGKPPNPKQVPASVSTSTSYKTECNHTDFIAIVHLIESSLLLKWEFLKYFC